MSRRWVIDGMNLIGTRPDGWWNDPDAAMRALTAQLEGYAAETTDDLTVVFDRRPRTDPPTGALVNVVFARFRGRNAADHQIHEMVADDSNPAALTVVTSDKRLAERVRELGARVVGSGTFRTRMEAATKSG